MTKTRTDRWHNTGGNGPASQVWCRKRKDRAVVVQVFPSHGLHNYKTCTLEEWEGKTRVATTSGVSFKFAKEKGDAFLGVPKRKSRARGKRFSVIGYYRDNNQPFVSWETQTSPQAAAKRAVETRSGHAIAIVEVVNGHVRGTLENSEVL